MMSSRQVSWTTFAAALALTALVAVMAFATEAQAEIMPAEPVSGWTFDGNFDDFFGSNHGTVDDGDDATSRIQFSSDTPFGSGQSVQFTEAGEGLINVGQPSDLMALRSEFSYALWWKPIEKHTTGGSTLDFLFSRWDPAGDDGDQTFKVKYPVPGRPVNG